MHRRDLLSAVGAAALATTAAPRAAVRDAHHAARSPRAADHTHPRTANRTDPPTLEPIANVPVRGANDVNVDERGETAYVTRDDGLLVVDVSDPADPTVLAERTGIVADLPRGPTGSVRDATVDGDRLLVTTHRRSDDPEGGAALLFDVSDPARPRRVASYEAPAYVHNGDVAGDYAYVIHSDFDRWPMVVLDATDDLAPVAKWSVLDAVPEWAHVHPTVRRLHDLHVVDDVAYLAYTETGAWLLDVSDPTEPTPMANLGGRDPGVVRAFTGNFTFEAFELPGNVAAVRPNGDRSLVAWSKEATDSELTDRVGGPGGVDVWRLHDDRKDGNRDADGRSPAGEPSDAGEPTDAGEHVVTLRPPETTRGITLAKNFGWRGDRLYVAFRTGGVRVYDLADPAAPLLVGAFRRRGDDFHTARAIAEGFVGLTVPSSRTRTTTNHLYTFPEPSGDGAVPAPTGTLYDPAGPTPTPLPPPAGTPTPRRTPPPPERSLDPPNGDGIPGFGPLAAVGSVAVAAALGAGRRIVGEQQS